MRHSRRLWTWIAVVALLALVAAACGQGTTTETTTTTAASTETTTTTAAGGATTTTTAAGGTTGFTYKVGIFEDLTTDNFWAYMDPESTVWNAYVLGPTKSTLFGAPAPTWQVIPDLATDQPAEATQEGSDWVVTQQIRQDYMWSDGTPVTANDVVFTYKTATEFQLGGNWLSDLTLYTPDDPSTPDVDESQDGIKSVEAVDDYTLKVTFSADPGLAVWVFGLGAMPVMSQNFWQAAVDEAATTDDPSTSLYAASGEGDPSSGTFIYDSREPGAYARDVANADGYYDGTTYTFYSDGTFQQTNDTKGFDEMYDGTGTGDVTLQYTEGPYASDAIYSIYSDQNSALLALKSGEIQFMLNPLGLSEGLKQEVLNSPELTLIANANYGVRYLAFNMRKAPMSFLGFRQAIGCLTDKEFLQTLLGGAIIPVYSMVPEGDVAWANTDVNYLCKGMDEHQRFDQALQYMKDDGFTWDVEPQWDDTTAGNLAEGTGTGLKDPNGTVVPPLELLAPGPGYDPLRSTASVWIAQWAHWMGIPVEANATGFNVIVAKVFAEGDAAKDWDMFILGWSLGSPALPDYFPSFFATWSDSANGGNNAPGYSNPDFDALAKQFNNATDIESAKTAVKAMDKMISEDLPYVTLFTTPVLEAYNNTLSFPFTDTLGGLQLVNGLPGSVQASE